MSRGAMTMRAIVERNTASGTDAFNNPVAPVFEAVSSEPIPCRAWIRARNTLTLNTEQVVMVEERHAIVPLSADVEIGDRLQNITDRLGNELFPGPLLVEGKLPRSNHYDLLLKVVE